MGASTTKYELIPEMINSKKRILVQISAVRGSKGSQRPVNDYLKFWIYQIFIKPH